MHRQTHDTRRSGFRRRECATAEAEIRECRLQVQRHWVMHGGRNARSFKFFLHRIPSVHFHSVLRKYGSVKGLETRRLNPHLLQ